MLFTSEIQPTTGGPRGHFSKAQLSDLQPITLPSMYYPRIHRGFYILCRTVTPATKDVGVNMIIEDTLGNVNPAALYNMQWTTPQSLDSWIPQGTIFILKEPFLKMSAAGQTLLRVESPTDIIFLHPSNVLLKDTPWFQPTPNSFEDLKARGNASFQEGKYETALHFYDMALQLQPNNSVVHLNKSAALLLLSRFFESYQSVQQALSDENSEVNETPRLKIKALFRVGQASYGLRDWVKAIDDFTRLGEDFPNETVGEKWLLRAQQRLSESRTGMYDMSVLGPTFGRPFKHDAADFVGPVKIVDIPGKGRGLCAITDVPEGTLLLAAKAFALSRYDRQAGLMSGNRMLLLTQVIQTFRSNPQRRTELQMKR
jgi:tetratricopeptide (TPR) repeat protein